MHLLDLLSKIEQEPAEEYPIGAYSDELVAWQLGEFRESRATGDSAENPPRSKSAQIANKGGFMSADRERW